VLWRERALGPIRRNNAPRIGGFRTGETASDNSKTSTPDGTTARTRRYRRRFEASLLSHEAHGKDKAMGSLLHYAIIFLIVALVAAFFGFGGVAGTAMGGAQLLFWAAIVLFIISAVIGLIRRA